jgi:RNA polymerase sigma-70 factor, ECF subfamily
MPKLRLYARSRVFSPADADDLVSETCVKLLEHEQKFRKEGNLMAWAVTILRNLHIDKTRSEARRGPRLVVSNDEADPLSEKKVVDRLQLIEVCKLIHTLPEEQREVLVLRGGGLSYDEIAASLNIPKGTMMSRLHRGRKALEELSDGKERVTA